MKRNIWFSSIILVMSALTGSPQINVDIKKHGEKPKIAVPDIRGAGDAQRFMNTFNMTLSRDVETSGQLTIQPKTSYPLRVPQQPSDFRPPDGSANPAPWFTDWSSPPVSANFLAFGYTAAQNGQMVLYGWLYDLAQTNTSSAQVFGKVYSGSLDEAGAKKISEEFACDIVKNFGGTCLLGTRIYFVSDRTGHKEIWSMNYDGTDQKQFTSYGSITTFPAVSADGTKIAFTTYPVLASSRGPDAFRSVVPQKRPESRAAANLCAFP